MTAEKCTCGEKPEESCPVCGEKEKVYWCEVCRQQVDSKRCPLCGLKTRKMPGERGREKGK